MGDTGQSIYFDRQGRPIDVRDWPSADERRVDKTTVGLAEVSTVHLVIDHQWGDGPPLIFETMIFGGEHDEWQDRYSTEAEAQAGHDRVVAALRAGETP